MFTTINSNERAVLLTSFLRWFDPFIIYTVVIGTYYNISLTEIFILQSVFSLVLMLLELPAGMFSDRYGRLSALMLSGFLFMVSGFLFWVKPSFVTWLLAEFVIAGAIACYSGTDTALLFEMCQREDGARYPVMESILQTCSRLAEFLAVIVGFLCLQLHHSTPIFFLMLAKVSMFTTVLYLRFNLLHEPRKTNSEGSTWPALKQSLCSFRLKCNISYAVSITTLSVTLFWMIQATMLQTQSLTMLFIWLGYYALASITSYLAAHLLPRLTLRRVMLPPFIVFTILGIACVMPDLKVIAITCSGCLFGFSQPLINMLINGSSEVDQRATIHSICAVCTRLMLAVVLPITGYLAQNHPVYGVWLWLLSLASLSLVFAAFVLATDSNKSVIFFPK